MEGKRPFKIDHRKEIESKVAVSQLAIKIIARITMRVNRLHFLSATVGPIYVLLS